MLYKVNQHQLLKVIIKRNLIKYKKNNIFEIILLKRLEILINSISKSTLNIKNKMMKHSLNFTKNKKNNINTKLITLELIEKNNKLSELKKK
jgi:hypothetical protein